MSSLASLVARDITKSFGPHVVLDGVSRRVERVTWNEAERPHESPEARITLAPEGRTVPDAPPDWPKELPAAIDVALADMARSGRGGLGALGADGASLVHHPAVAAWLDAAHARWAEVPLAVVAAERADAVAQYIAEANDD